MANKTGKTRERRPKKKNNKRTRKQNKKIAKPDSYLATTNADNGFVMVDDAAQHNAPIRIDDDPQKIVVGKIFANWCGHCQSMKDDWNSLDDKLDKNMYIVLNTEENEIPNRIDEINQIYLKDSNEKLTASGYPTIYRIEQNKLKYYDGDRKMDAMYDWFVNQKGGNNEKSATPSKKDVPIEKKGWFSWW